MQISQINIYPLKSTQARQLEQVEVTRHGLANDRRWALIGEDDVVLTGRDFPRLLDLTVNVDSAGIQVIVSSENIVSIPFPTENDKRVPIHIFSNSTTGRLAQDAVNQLFSDYLQTPARLVYMDNNSERSIGVKYGGTSADTVSLADEAPVLIISEASLADLNARLPQPITMAHFRPNLVVTGALPYAEDDWKNIKIGGATFKAGRHCKRCVFTTINPITKEKNPQGEPLRTLAKYREGKDGGVIFGLHLIPTKLGEIRVGDEVVVK